MKKKIGIAIVGYRDWAKTLYTSVQELSGHDYSWFDSIRDLKRTDTRYFTATFLVGWSEIVPEDFYRGRDVFVLHPSPLPAYRGGSPIQHQILAGEEGSAVSIFKLDPAYPEVDSGPIACRLPYSLEGDLSEVLARIAQVGARCIASVVDALATGGLLIQPQNFTGSKVYQRRKPEESEITPAELQTATARYLYDKVRALQDPYPNAFIRTADGGRLYLTRAHYEEAHI